MMTCSRIMPDMALLGLGLGLGFGLGVGLGNMLDFAMTSAHVCLKHSSLVSIHLPTDVGLTPSQH
jgi:hypothetical protein